MHSGYLNLLFAAIATMSVAFVSAVEAADCGMSKAFTHATKHHGKRTVYSDGDSLFFTAPMAVNTDGAPISYHPDDPGGSNGKAINTICNGANAIMPDGSKLNYSQCSALIDAYRKAKASGWDDPMRPRMDFFGVAAKGYTPCIIKDGPYAGYFVSTTSLSADDAKPLCSQERYLNSLEIPFAIYPNAKAFKSRGVGKKDIVVYYNPALDSIEYGIIGDRGPSWGLAEGSVAFAKALNQRTDNPKTRKDTYNFGVRKVHALVLPNASLEPPYTLENVRKRAREGFEAWGGRKRFDTCIQSFGS